MPIGTILGHDTRYERFRADCIGNLNLITSIYLDLFNMYRSILIQYSHWINLWMPSNENNVGRLRHRK